MDNLNEPPTDPWPATQFTPPAPDPQPERSFGGIRRGVATLALSGMLLIVGGAAVAFAASPDPSASPAPGATTTPNGGTTTPKSTHDCPNMGGNGTNPGTNRGTTPSPVTPTTPTAPSSPSV
jgi:hypothetical protein